jgi:hypothetical protein
MFQETFLAGQDYIMDFLAELAREKVKALEEKRAKQPQKRLSLSSKPPTLSHLDFSFKIYFCIEIFFKLRKEDVDAVSLFYLQHKRDVRVHSFPLSDFDLINLCAVELILDRGPSRSDFELKEETIRKLIPESSLKNNHPDVWTDPISCCYESLSSKGLSPHELKFEYLTILERYDLFSAKKYRALYRKVEADEYMVQTPRELMRKIVILGIKPLNLILAEPETKKTFLNIDFKHILRWGISGSNIFLINTDNNNLHLFETDYAEEIDHLITQYTNMALGSQFSPRKPQKRKSHCDWDFGKKNGDEECQSLFRKE